MYFAPWATAFIGYSIVDLLSLVYVGYNFANTRQFKQQPMLLQVVIGIVALSLMLDNVRIALGGFTDNLQTTDVRNG